jgi:hypothetical protein
LKKHQVEIGATYLVRVRGIPTKVLVTRRRELGGWYGTNLKTGREIRIKSAQRLRRQTPPVPILPTAEPRLPSEAAPPQPTPQRVAGQRNGSKAAAVLEAIGRPGGITLSGIQDLTQWQRHTVRGFICTLNKKTRVESFRDSDGNRTYRLAERLAE